MRKRPMMLSQEQRDELESFISGLESLISSYTEISELLESISKQLKVEKEKRHQTKLQRLRRRQKVYNAVLRTMTGKSHIWEIFLKNKGR